LLAFAPADRRARSLSRPQQETESVLRNAPGGQAFFVLRLRPHERETASGGDAEQRRQYGSTYYRSTLAWQVQDVLTALAYLTGLAGFREVQVAGLGEAGIPSLLARALEPSGKVSLTMADLDRVDDDEGTWTGARTQSGMLRLGGLRAAAILAAPGKLVLHNAGAHCDLAAVRTAYRGVGFCRLSTGRPGVSARSWIVSDSTGAGQKKRE
jgi:hypothetical protein